MESTTSKKRANYIEWGDFFMSVALIAAQRSKDQSTQVGACIVNEDTKKIVATGYNGLPWGCSDDEFPWARSSERPDEPLETKTLFIVHAELNAILNKNSESIKDCTMYSTLFPCCRCAQAIIQTRMRRIVYLSDKYHEKPEYIASRRMLDAAGVEYTKHEPRIESLTISFVQPS
jgi:dCMP deaminase